MTEGRPRPIDKLKAVYLSVFIDVLGIGLVIPVLPYLVLSFPDTSASTVGLTIAVYSIAQIPGSIISGAISDVYGRRVVLLASIGSSALSFLFCGLAKTLPMILVARAASGLTGGSISVAQAVVADCTTVEERPKFLGLIGASIGIAFTFGPGIGAGAAAIVEAAGGGVKEQYSIVFYIAAAFGALGFVYAWRNLEETRPETRGLAEQKKDDKDEEKKEDGDMKKYFIPIIFTLNAMFWSNYAFTVMQSTYGVLIFEEWGWSTTALGSILVVSGLEIAVLQGKLIKPIVDRTGKHVSSALSNLLLGVFLLALPLTVGVKPLHFLAFALHVAGFSLGQTALPALLSRFASTDGQGKALGLGQAVQAASRVVAPVASGYLYDNSEEILGMEYLAPYLVGGVACAAAGVPLVFIMQANKRGEKGEGGGEKGEGKEDGDVELGEALVVAKAAEVEGAQI
ncbi:hypothetical protein TrCOL_g9213 [Triparma columacea]|uniref:Major facilitator superfamily (MFS) profile domain-containing protein n=1 Tax=Triparma columacea TaxID=722753 RepID=A0A9W7L3J9_9STRA|nr:hypothetical protein TrCOL_g9213 [Triparma columacea]